MPKFKENQKVVFVGGDPNQDPKCSPPTMNEIVTVSYFHTYYKAYVLKGYELTQHGKTQYFHEFELKEIQEINSQYTDELINSLTEKIKQPIKTNQHGKSNNKCHTNRYNSNDITNNILNHICSSSLQVEEKTC